MTLHIMHLTIEKVMLIIFSIFVSLHLYTPVFVYASLIMKFNEDALVCSSTNSLMLVGLSYYETVAFNIHVFGIVSVELS